MSASSKKKLRAEENAAKLTEKQLSERKEAKKLRIYTIAFGVVLAVMIVTFHQRRCPGEENRCPDRWRAQNQQRGNELLLR